DLGGERFGWQTCPPPGPFVIDSSPREAAVCTLTPTSVVYDLDVGGKDFEGSIDLSATGYPAGATAVFGDNPIVVVPAGDWEPTTLTIDNLGSATAGAYALAISGVDQADPTNVFQVDVALNVYTDAPDSAVLIGPADGAAGEAALPTFSWQPTAQAQGYTLQIATDPAFTQNLREVTGVTSPYTLGDPALASGTVYYWRVRATNICGSQDSATWAFRTAAYGCTTYTSTNVPQAISNRSWTQSTLTIPDSLIFDNVDVNIDQIIHTNDADLDIYIRHPDMTQIDLSTDNGGSGDNYTLTIFDNEAATPITSGSAPFTGRFQPEGNLGALYNKNAQGTWTLRVYDDANPNTGTLNAWSLTVCGGSAPMPADYSDLAGSYGVAWHTGDGAVRLGTGWDADTTFSPTDDNDSDDGVSFPNGWAPGQSNTVRVNVQGTPTHGRWLRLWFDWNDDGVFEDTTGPGGERVYDGTVVGDNNDLGVSVPAGLNQPVNYRARLYDSAGAPTGVLAQDAGSFGGADGGEVEDGTKEAPTAVTLTRFEAWPAGPAIHVEWEAATELDNLGFNLYRSDAIDGVYQRLNSYLIPAQVPGSPAGAAYFWTDRQVAPGQVYYYKLEAVDLHGVAMFYGQVSATAAHVAHLPLVIK
ncbi:MAG: proprotein convertase P-domain-containing protein, partial [Anaerolineae bacterium]|nr:proprotein convertase P-domain-containing protein [Anaerolineae bacterium]